MPVVRRQFSTGIVFMLCIPLCARVAAQSIPTTLAAEPVVPFTGIVAALCLLAGWVIGRWRAKKMLGPIENTMKK